MNVDVHGLIDMHVHSAPDVRPRFADDVKIARLAREAGLRAVLLKSHVTLTADRAAIAEKAVGGIRVFGGLALNYAVGGLNPAAVEVALRMGAMQVWMPTLDAAHHRREYGQRGGISLLDAGGQMVPVVHEILELVARSDAMLSTGHLSPAETVELVKLARQKGLKKIVVTHPEAPFLGMPASLQEEIAGDGVYFERCYVDTIPEDGRVASFAEIATNARRVGIESTVMSTDFGQAENPPPVEGLRACVAELLKHGFNPSEVRRVFAENPALLLGLDG